MTDEDEPRAVMQAYYTATLDALRTGRYPDRVSDDVADVWVAISALEARVAGHLESQRDGLAFAPLSGRDADEVASMAARLATLSAIARRRDTA